MESKEQRKLRMNRERQARWRARQTPEVLNQQQQQRRSQESPEVAQARRASDAEAHRFQRSQEIPEVAEARRASDAEAHRFQRSQEIPEVAAARREANVEAHRFQRSQEAPDAAAARRIADLVAHREAEEVRTQAVLLESQFVHESQIVRHTCGPMNSICQFCGSRNFAGERPSDGYFNSCCHKGKVKLEKPRDANGIELDYPDLLRSLMADPLHPYYSNFRKHIRSYNSCLSFASMGAKVATPPGNGPYVFRVHGQIYHLTSALHPPPGEERKFAQLYVLDSTQSVAERLNLPENNGCLPEIIRPIDQFLREHNRIADSFRMLKDIEQEEQQMAENEGRPVHNVNMVMRRDRRADQRRYNTASANEIAMVFVNEDGEPPFERDIRIYPIIPEGQNRFTNINILSPNLDPMTYAILYPYGEPGWQPNWHNDGFANRPTRPNVDGQRRRENVSMLQYKVAQTAIRSGFNPIISAGKLSQQWIVDSHLQVEANTLNFHRYRQTQLRRELYQGLADHMANDAANLGVQAGVPVILPSTFQGSPRNMRERCNDAMAIFSKHGSIDLFVTVTANPAWSEITENLLLGETSADRPDLVARVFRLKLKAIMEDLVKHGVLGKCIAFVYSIEFQKRGLPHAHILLVLQQDDKLKTACAIDAIVTAELPNPTTEPLLLQIVTRCMIHGPCGPENPQAPCMENGNCKKKFPKPFQNETKPNVNGYPLYRRREGPSAVVRNVEMHNGYVVPYNKYLLLKYNCHINVEVCTSIKAVKYIYKYIYKGYDCAKVEFHRDDQVLQHNEINDYIDARYVSACEAMWRILEFPMHDRSHVVYRLPVHLPNMQQIYFEAGREEEALNDARAHVTKLTAWFALNTRNEQAREYVYTDIPTHFVYARGAWEERQRGAHKVVTRMYTVGAKDQERFCLRLLLLHVPGATSFEYLRTVNNVVYETFKEAALHRNLLSSDAEWDRCLQEASTFQMPFQMRQSFAYICAFCSPTNASALWDKFKQDLAMDYMRNHSIEESYNFALHDINFVLQQHGYQCKNFDLPQPTGNRAAQVGIDPLLEQEESVRRISTLNHNQRAAFDAIVDAMNSQQAHSKCFFLDGPGGSGKTYLYNTLMSFVRGRRQVVLPFATTGIASTLMKGGRTVHSGFKLPVPLDDRSVSSISLGSDEAKLFIAAILIIIDEVTMLSKHGLRCIDAFLRDLMKNNLPFGGKVIVIGGDFRQTLPVVPGGSERHVIEECIKSSALWRHFVQLPLHTNMRSEGQNVFNQWLLDIGTGTIPAVDGIVQGSILIPAVMVITSDIVTAVYGTNLASLTLTELAKRVILCPKNSDALEINNHIIRHLPGQQFDYFSSDEVVSDDESDVRNYPSEFLHTLCPSGMPPHKLTLKIGSIVMLLRNLNPKAGLCNGTRLYVRRCYENTIVAEILSECNRGDIVNIPRIDFKPSDVNLPFVLKRRQFPIIPAFSMTINKSQGQTFEHVGIFLNEPVFSHGQLYVALSRSRQEENIKVVVMPAEGQGCLLGDGRIFTRNVIFRQAFL